VDARGAVVVAMSGGVDSSVAAALLCREGAKVVGATLRLWSDAPGLGDESGPGRTCTTIEDARAVAAHLGIPHVVLDRAAAFDRHVAQPFADIYRRGETPNPCVPCNAQMKFGELLRAAQDWGAVGLATGHYARIRFYEPTGRYRLYRAADRRKDQSYFLYALRQDQLAAARFPLGTIEKTDTRRLARDFGLPVADKAESQQACFARGDYRAYLRERLGPVVAPGVIRDTGGAARGWHDGMPFYTVGQRHGLGLGNPRPLYVVALVPETNEVIVGDDRDLWVREVEVEATNYVAVDRLSEPTRVLAKIRYAHEPQPATATPLSASRLCLAFDNPQRAVAPGQAAVLYDTADPEMLLAGGTICRPSRSPNAPGDGAGLTWSRHG
jgi:tRNA-specific 2-thiouridylase